MELETSALVGNWTGPTHILEAKITIPSAVLLVIHRPVGKGSSKFDQSAFIMSDLFNRITYNIGVIMDYNLYIIEKILTCTIELQSLKEVALMGVTGHNFKVQSWSKMMNSIPL